MKNSKTTKKGLNVSRYFTKEGKSVYDLFEYDMRASVIRNPNGETVFEMNNVEVPKTWSQVATDILAQKYFRKAGVPQKDGSLGSENSIKQVAHRLADCWKEWGNKYNYFASNKDAEIFYDELVYTIMGQYAAPNSPQWFNTGLYSTYGITGKPQGHYFVNPDTGKLEKSTSAYERPQPHACFILSVDDDLVNEGGIMNLWVREARIFKYGSGVGTNFSNIRGENEKLSGGGYSSGLMSFLKIGDRAAGAIKSGGTTRRAAKMVCLDLDHPEIVEFVNWKVKEEEKVAALIEAGYPSDYEGEAYKTVSGQNSNNSVRIPNSFFKALEEKKDWELTARTDGSVIDKVDSQKLWDQIAYAAWRCADPGVQYDTTINEWHTCPEDGPIRASNPCSEYMFLDNTACNLASINLRKLFDVEKTHFDVEGFKHTCRIWTIVLEISVLMAQFPSKEVAQRSYDYRTLGLGFANLGSMLMVSGIPYDSEKGRTIAGAVSAIMTGTSYATSAEMAAHLGPFPRYKNNKKSMLRVMRNHRFAAYNAHDAYEGLETKPQGIDPEFCPDYLLEAATNSWDAAIQLGEKYGYRNAQTTVIAPTGTIGLVMDCDTTGVEPDFALVKFKKLSGGGYFKIINQSIPQALRNLGYSEKEIDRIVKYAKGHSTLEGAPHINYETLRAKGFTEEELEKIETQLPSTFELGFVFNRFTLGDATMRRMGFLDEDFMQADFSLLNELGFSDDEIEEANDYVCGTMTIEGAPELKDEHLPVFDCANRNGRKGVRYIHPHGHIKMMAKVQPFISGAISKTINLPNEANVDEIKECYELSWSLGLKANALYRDGCKMSQPLSNKSDKKKSKTKVDTEEINLSEETLDLSTLTVEQILEVARNKMIESPDTSFKRELSKIVERKKLPNKRKGFTQKVKIDNHTVFVRTGDYGDGTLGEIFIDMHKEGASYRSIINCFAIAVSIGLQYGVPLEEFVNKFAFTRFEPSGNVQGHPNIKTTTSVIDFVFRMLGYEYLDRKDLVHVQTEIEKVQESEVVKPKPSKELKSNSISNKSSDQEPLKITFSRNEPEENDKNSGTSATQDYMSSMMGDAPSCNVCGHITIRNGTCYKCLNCGNSMGCS
ncbi:MAG: vitamin B12-dependent ribonucleotide reductase [Chitinophagaceae bacterium]|nr:MAG: vitamin B12-dependent ribonucleotide reductase [Chitinophagaceae bacterium]